MFARLKMKRVSVSFLLTAGYLFLLNLLPASAQISSTGTGINLDDPAACQVPWKFEGGLLPPPMDKLILTSSPAEFIVSLFRFALGFAAFLALVMIVVAGIEYTASGGNPGAQGKAKERIQNALLGLGLLLASFVILSTINPSLTTVVNPTLKNPLQVTAQKQCYSNCRLADTLTNKIATCADVPSTLCDSTKGEKCGYTHVYGEGRYDTNIYCCGKGPGTASGGGGALCAPDPSPSGCARCTTGQSECEKTSGCCWVATGPTTFACQAGGATPCAQVSNCSSTNCGACTGKLPCESAQCSWNINTNVCQTPSAGATCSPTSCSLCDQTGCQAIQYPPGPGTCFWDPLGKNPNTGLPGRCLSQ